MLHNIRKTADSFTMRIILALIAVIFVAFGVTGALQGGNNQDIVTFSKAVNISNADFLKAKAEEINLLQLQNGITLSDDDIKQLNIDNIILQRLINERMINYLASYYDLDLSGKSVIEFIKKSPVFQNEQGEFDIEIFNSTFKNSYYKESEYLQNVKEQLLKRTLLNVFLEVFKTPETMVQNKLDYISETRVSDILRIDLKYKSKDYTPQEPTQEQLSQFYEKNRLLFTEPEKRTFQYVKVSAEELEKKVHFSRKELESFYNDNKDEFGESFEKSKDKVAKTLKLQKLQELSMEFAKNLEDDIASGSNLKEIAEKYSLGLEQVEDLSYAEILAKKPEVLEIADNIFGMTEGEVLYPIELEDKSGFLSVELMSAQPSRLKDFEKSVDLARTSWQEHRLKEANMEVIAGIAKEYNKDPKKFAPPFLTSLGVNINKDVALTRVDLGDNNNFSDKLPVELAAAIFQVKPGLDTPVYETEDKAYFAYIKSSKVDSSRIPKLRKLYGEAITSEIKNSVLEELINYLIKQNKVKISYNSSVTEH